MSNKPALSLRSLSKCSLTQSKLRFFELSKPKISSCYTTFFRRECDPGNVLDAHRVRILTLRRLKFSKLDV